VSALDGIASALFLIVLGIARFAKPAVFAGAALIGLLTFYSPAPRETAITIVIEAPIVLFGLRTLRMGGWPVLAACGLANTLTQPLFAAMLRQTAPEFWWRAFAAGEVGVWLLEAAIYFALLPALRERPGGAMRALLVSLAANGASAGVGLLLPF
jgi:hypothetical protein